MKNFVISRDIMMNEEKNVVVVAGPTGSGKSALALEQAEKLGGAIINADSMQVYKDLLVLTARPSNEDMEKVPHYLYGVRKGDDVCSAALWLDEAVKVIKDVWDMGKIPFVVGGSGMYISALLEGLAPVPDVPLDIRNKVRNMSLEEAKDMLQSYGVAVNFTDRQRVARALEIYLATGRSHLSWQQEPRMKMIDANFKKIVLEPDRLELYQRINARFLKMIEEGAVDEVENLLLKGYDESVPLMKALGVSEIRAFLQGEITKIQMIDDAQQSSRNYAKRQITWFRNKF